MNPALDIAFTTARVVPTERLRCSAPRNDPGGSGINLARAVHKLGGAAVAVFPIGGPAGARSKKIACQTVAVAGSIRENFAVGETQTGRQFRFVMPGPILSAEEQQRCLDQIASLAPKPRYLIASGSLPPGVPGDFYARVAEHAKPLGARLVIDASGAALRNIGFGNVYLLKPNLRELGELTGRAVVEPSQQEAAARQLVLQHQTEIQWCRSPPPAPSRPTERDVGALTRFRCRPQVRSVPATA
jgi:6-phosphofructokinase 2